MQAFLTINLNILRRRKAPSADIAKGTPAVDNEKHRTDWSGAVIQRMIDLIDWQDEDSVNK